MAQKLSTADRKPHPIDVHVGKRIRMRRALLGLSQEKLADAVGLTFQQIQKYERGANRVSASRLYQFSKIMDVSISYFYQEYDEERQTANTIPSGLSDGAQESFATEDVLYTKETIDLLKAYYSLDNKKKRKELIKIIRSMVESMKSD